MRRRLRTRAVGLACRASEDDTDPCRCGKESPWSGHDRRSGGGAVSLWITEAEVVRLMDMKGAIAALDRALALEAAGKAENMVKTHAIWGGHHTLHAIGATFADEGFVGTKTWAHANGAAPRSEERRVGKGCRS